MYLWLVNFVFQFCVNVLLCLKLLQLYHSHCQAQESVLDCCVGTWQLHRWWTTHGQMQKEFCSLWFISILVILPGQAWKTQNDETYASLNPWGFCLLPPALTSRHGGEGLRKTNWFACDLKEMVAEKLFLCLSLASWSSVATRRLWTSGLAEKSCKKTTVLNKDQELRAKKHVSLHIWISLMRLFGFMSSVAAVWSSSSGIALKRHLVDLP